MSDGVSRCSINEQDEPRPERGSAVPMTRFPIQVTKRVPGMNFYLIYSSETLSIFRNWLSEISNLTCHGKDSQEKKERHWRCLVSLLTLSNWMGYW